jgi:hypothetical protein
MICPSHPPWLDHSNYRQEDIRDEKEVYEKGKNQRERGKNKLLLPIDIFRGVSWYSSANAGILHRLGYHRFFLNTSQFIFNLSFYHSPLCSPGYNSVVKSTTRGTRR